MEQWLPILSILLGMSPSLIVYLIGMTMSFVYWRRFRTANLLLLLACLGSVLLLLIQAVLRGWYFPHLYATTDTSNVQRAIQTVVFGIGLNLLDAIMFALMIWAVFAGRRKQVE